MEKNYILSPEVAAKKLKRMAFEILENNFGETSFILAGIRESGTVIAEVIQRLLTEIAGLHTELITVSLDKKILPLLRSAGRLTSKTRWSF